MFVLHSLFHGTSSELGVNRGANAKSKIKSELARFSAVSNVPASEQVARGATCLYSVMKRPLNGRSDTLASPAGSGLRFRLGFPVDRGKCG